MRTTMILGGLAAAGLSLATFESDARACGGCFHEPLPPTQSGTVVTDHRMIFTVSPQQTTLYDQIKYSGAPSSFAWVLPIHGAVTVGLSADIVFSALDRATQTTIVAPTLPACPVTYCPCYAAAGPAFGFADASASAADAGVTVIKQQVVGPYATVQLHPNTTTDTAAVTDWLVANGYSVGSDQAVIAAYVSEGFDFLALRLRPGQGIQAMRPISVKAPGASLSLPLRMVAAGTGSTVGITLWVIGAGRYEPQNFQSFIVADSDLVWDWSRGSSNYTTVRAQKEKALNNAAWQIESSLDVSPLQVENVVLGSLASDDYPPPLASDAGAGPAPTQVRQQDLTTLFPTGNTSVRITRMRADLSHAALAADLQIQAAADQSVLSNDYQVSQSVNAPSCPPPPVCNCGVGSSGSSSGSPGGSSGGGSGSGSGGSSSGSSGDAGGTPAGQPTPQESFSCSASPSRPAGAGLGLVLAGLGLALGRARRKR